MWGEILGKFTSFWSLEALHLQQSELWKRGQRGGGYSLYGDKKINAKSLIGGNAEINGVERNLTESTNDSAITSGLNYVL
jgi:hypothetical protein